MSYVLAAITFTLHALNTLNQVSKGYRTYAAYAVSVCAAIVTAAGLIPGTTGVALAVLFTALGGVFQRFATADHAFQLSDVTTAIKDISDAVRKFEDTSNPPPEPEPDVLKFPTPGNRTKAAAILLFFTLAGAATAAPPRAVIEGPDPSLSGEIIVLDATNSEGEPTSYSWEMTPEIKGRRNLMPFDGGKKVIPHTFPGTYLIELIVSNSDGHSRAVRQFTVPGTPPPSPTPTPVPPQPVPTPVPPVPTPVPTPSPGPTPAPSPGPEPALTGLALSVFTAAQAVNSPTRANEAKCLADGCVALASALKAGKYSGSSLAIGQGAVKEMSEVMDRCATPPWLDARELFATKIEGLWKDGKLKTADDWAQTVNQIEQGLRRVK